MRVVYLLKSGYRYCTYWMSSGKMLIKMPLISEKKKLRLILSKRKYIFNSIGDQINFI